MVPHTHTDKHTSQTKLASAEKSPTQESTNDSRKDPPIQETHDQLSTQLQECVERDGCAAVQGESLNEPCSDVMPTLRRTEAVNKRPRRRHTIDRERRRAIFEPVPEEEILIPDEGFSDSAAVAAVEKKELCSPSSPKKKDFWKYFQSEEVQENYGKKTVAGVLSDFKEWHFSNKTPTHELHPPTQQTSTLSSDRSQPHTSLSRTPSNTSKASGRSSGYYSIRSSDARLSQLSLESSLMEDHEYMDFEESSGSPSPPFEPDGLASHFESCDPFAEMEFRSRSSSLPSNSQKLAKSIISRGIGHRHTSSSSSSTSLASDDSETTNTSSSESQYNSQSSLLDHTSSGYGE